MDGIWLCDITDPIKRGFNCCSAGRSEATIHADKCAEARAFLTGSCVETRQTITCHQLVWVLNLCVLHRPSLRSNKGSSVLCWALSTTLGRGQPGPVCSCSCSTRPFLPSSPSGPWEQGVVHASPSAHHVHGCHRSLVLHTGEDVDSLTRPRSKVIFHIMVCYWESCT